MLILGIPVHLVGGIRPADPRSFTEIAVRRLDIHDIGRIRAPACAVKIGLSLHIFPCENAGIGIIIEIRVPILDVNSHIDASYELPFVGKVRPDLNSVIAALCAPADKLCLYTADIGQIPVVDDYNIVALGGSDRVGGRALDSFPAEVVAVKGQSAAGSSFLCARAVRVCNERRKTRSHCCRRRYRQHTRHEL